MKRTLVIGDIHGCSKAMDTLLREIKATPEDVLVTLGDYVDRGPDSKGVLDRLMALETCTQLVPLMGNHEVLFLEAWRERTLEAPWMGVGGRQTLESYAGGGDLSWDVVPEAHRTFLTQRCRRYHETATHIFVHGGLDPLVPLEQQTDDWLLWSRFESSAPHASGKIVVCGHTAQRSGMPLRGTRSLCIDTWAYGEGWLSGLIIEFGLVIQANQKGQVRRFSLDHTPMLS